MPGWRGTFNRALAFIERDVFLGRIRGTDVRVGISLLALIGVVLALELLRFDVSRVGNTATFLAFLIAGVLLHELGHAAAARRMHIRTLAIELNLFGGIARLARPPENTTEEIAIAMAGPAVNLGLAGVIYLLKTSVYPDAGLLWSAPYLYGLMHQAFTANMILGVFNLLPGYPLDGGRAVRALLTLRLSRRKSRIVVARLGQGLGVFLGLFGAGLNAVNVIIGIMIFLAASEELRLAQKDQAILN